MLGASESALYADSKVVWVPLMEYAGHDGGVDEGESAATDSAVRAKSMVSGVDRDVAVEGDTGSSSSSLGSSAKESAAPGVAVDEKTGPAAARRGMSVRQKVPHWLM